MRQAGKLPSEDQARRFVDYLLTKEMPARAEAIGSEFAIWIHEEDQFQQAREELETFRAEPTHERYESAVRQADSIRTEKVKQAQEARKQVTEMRSQWSRSTSQSKPLTIALIVISVIVFVLSGAQRTNSTVGRTLSFTDPIHFVGSADTVLDPTNLNDKLTDIKAGQVWRTITPMFLHGDIFHIAFNMLLMYQLGSLIEPRIGTPRYGLLVLLTGLASVTLTTMMPFRLVLPIEFGNNTSVIGMSGVVFGLIGYLWGRSMTAPFFGIMLNPNIFIFAVGYIVVGVSGIFGQLFGLHISNWGHLIGLLGGLAMAFVEAGFNRK